MAWFTTPEQIYGQLAGWNEFPFEEAIAMDMAGLALPMSADSYQFPLNEVITEKVQATMDVPDNVMLDSPYGPQEVEMFNIPPRTEPSPIFMGDQFFDPWDVSTQMPHSLDFSDYMEEMVEEPVEAKPQELDEHEAKVESIKEKIADKLNEVIINPAEKFYVDALEKQKQLNKRLVDELKGAKSALQRKADVAKELATKAKEAAKKAKESEGELKQKLHDAAEKVAEKAKEQAQEVKEAAVKHAKEVERKVEQKIKEAKAAMKHAEEKREKKETKSSLLSQLDSIYGNSDLITDEELNSLFEIDDDFLRFMLV